MIETHLDQMRFVTQFEYGKKKKLLPNYHNQLEDVTEDF